MLATDILREEHRIILGKLDILEEIALRLEHGDDTPLQTIPALIVFFRSFADKYHHGKEEDELFPALQRAGFVDKRGAITIMLCEHDHGRRLVADIEAAAASPLAGDTDSRHALVISIRRYIGLLWMHIYKEDNGLFPLVDAFLSGEQQSALLVAFERVNRELVDLIAPLGLPTASPQPAASVLEPPSA